MKKILLFIVALVATLSMNAQTTEIYNGNTKEATYYGADVTVKFGVAGEGQPTIEVYKGNDLMETYKGSDYKVVSKKLPPSTGTAKRTGNIDVNWVQLWAGGPKFAEYNVGVTDGNAKSYGGYYCWGKATDKDSQGAYKDGTSALSGDDDTATKLWGENWRMPTSAELQALLNNCNVEWKDNYNGTAGLLCTGKDDYASNSIFLPAAGYFSGGYVGGQSINGIYWSSTPDGSNNAKSLDFKSSKQLEYSFGRDDGFSVRAVLYEEDN